MKTQKLSAKFLDEAAADWVARLDAGALTPENADLVGAINVLKGGTRPLRL